ncbi:MAG: aspartyl protease family protein [Candidatus Eremiobacteraeota bacterium]|nr:aspartyl protease family protein [Candidatus Eremiobacteraeota bacterium]
MSATCSTAIKNTSPLKIHRNTARIALVAALLCAQSFAIPAPVRSATEVTLASVLRAHQAALSRFGNPDPRTVETQGAITGVALFGTFHSWHAPARDRLEQTLGMRTETTLRIGDREFIQNSSGDVRELSGLLSRRQITQDFILSSDLFAKPQYSKLIGETLLPDGMQAYRVEVKPPKGQEQTVYFDAATGLIDRIAYVDGDGVSTIDYSDYHTISGAVMAFKEVDSDGDHQYDITEQTKTAQVDKPILPAVFKPLPNTVIETAGPQTVPIVERAGHIYTQVAIRGKSYWFLVDTGAQSVVLDSRVATDQTLLTQGQLQVRGAQRTGGLGIAQLDYIHIGAARLPVHDVAVLNLNSSTDGAFPIQGILGYPFFAAAEVRIDFDTMTMTFGPPGSLKPLGEKLALDVDRETPEVAGEVNGVGGKFLIDTGNGNELLVFHPFVLAHAGVIPYAGAKSVSSFGVGGTTDAVAVNIDQLNIGSYRLFNRYANVILSDSGAFADRFDAGNIGLATLRSFIVSFDLANEAMYLQKGAHFDDGRYRSVYR